VYDVPHGGVRKMAFMQQEITRLSDATNEYLQLLQWIRVGTDNEAAEVLARLRLGDSVNDIIANMKGVFQPSTIEYVCESSKPLRR
jgi:hypothetical protein